MRKLLPIIRQFTGKQEKLRKAIASAFFKDKTSPDRLAANTIISLKGYGIVDGECKVTPFGDSLLAAQADIPEAHRLLAKRILVDLDGIGIVETLREMATGGMEIDLNTLASELQHRGIEASDNSSDLSSVLGWLREASVIANKYDVNDTEYSALIGMSPVTLQAAKEMSSGQVGFLRAILALNVTDWVPYNAICQHAEALYAGEFQYNWKDIVDNILKPLTEKGLIEIRKKAKQDVATPEGRGGKPTDVKPTAKFEKEFAEPILSALYKCAGYNEIRKIRGTPLYEIVSDVEQSADPNKRGKALEILTIRLCQLLDLSFLGWRETDDEMVAGGEVDALLHSTRLTYSRWQVQCKVGQITYEAVAKENGVKDVTLANVILIVGTKKATDGAQQLRKRLVGTSNLNIIIIDGPILQAIIKDPTYLLAALRQQAENALSLKPAIQNIQSTPPSGGAPPDGGGTPGDSGAPSSSSSGPPSGQQSFDLAYSTRLGKAFRGDSLAVLPSLISQGVRVKLIVTSPPFALIRKKDYGNEDAEQYVKWFEQFVPLFKQILLPEGSLVIDIGGPWIEGIPAKSMCHYKLLVRLCENGLYLAQDFYHYNPARLPTPAEWVTIRRIRVKDAINNVWWLALDPFVKSDNRKVLRPYSASMRGLLKNGYKAQLRPSGHDISSKFQKDNGGAIPPNLLEFANTESNSHYLRRCKEERIKPHPARFPQALPEFFIKLLTDPGDLILDPFAGSNVSGAAAEALDRQWISVEFDPAYVTASRFRFEQDPIVTPHQPRHQPTATQSLSLF